MTGVSRAPDISVHRDRRSPDETAHQLVHNARPCDALWSVASRCSCRAASAALLRSEATEVKRTRARPVKSTPTAGWASRASGEPARSPRLPTAARSCASPRRTVPRDRSACRRRASASCHLRRMPVARRTLGGSRPATRASSEAAVSPSSVSAGWVSKRAPGECSASASALSRPRRRSATARTTTAMASPTKGSSESL